MGNDITEIAVENLESIIESILFVSGEPVKITRIAAVLGVSNEDIKATAGKMRDKYSFERRGIRLVILDDSLQLCSSPEFADYIRLTLESRKHPQLSGPALEVLAIIAYFEPVTRAYIEQLRGVESSYTVGVLSDRGLIEACGRLSVPGRPMLYKTTHTFLRTFGLESLNDLPELPYVEPGDDGRDGIHNAILELRERQRLESEAPETLTEQSLESEPPATLTEQSLGSEPPETPAGPEEETAL
jgi:segregation and condensation protein B